ncbi:hypothetical protein [Vibrio vulnificus]|uniref:hypothetical protein n=1 Tax=Vibrio vulnificus TaxID=672 RepID=UPI000CD07CE6|nr:hypothetical protein [Vibrio vulnificus]POC16150.1 hypothetical protein CRN39_02310 [Vibrio vulnificus]
MKAQIVLSSGAHPVFLKSTLKGDIVTTFDQKHALTLPDSTAKKLLPMVKRLGLWHNSPTLWARNHGQRVFRQ